MGVPLNCIEPLFKSSLFLANPKSHNLTFKALSTKKLCDLISL